MRKTATMVLSALLLFASGCQLYFGDHPGDDDDCVDPATGDEAFRPLGLDPNTLVCEADHGGCPRPGGAPGLTDIKTSSYDWAPCYSACEGLSENACVLADGCRAIYRPSPAPTPCPAGANCNDIFAGCVATAPSGPVRGGDCTTLSAYECSRHDDCSARHASLPGAFQQCLAERTSVCTGTGDVPAQLLRDPVTGKCGAWGGGCAGAEVPAVPDFGVCGSPCEALAEASCRAADGCRAIYADTPDTFAPTFKACWPTAPSGPVHGSCEGLAALECSRHDDCVAVHVAIAPDCPASQVCPVELGNFSACHAETVPPPACATLGEAACISRSDCDPLYQGENCSCTPAGCTCQKWIFEACTPGS